ncbi:MAG: IclR family transcriptional regulator [Xanthobacteraceae bacterium]|nr:IclR family transcriptional regulator [Xanthobacteraceae bacterium]
MSSLKRMLAVFDVFTPEEPGLTAEAIMARLNYTRGTGYRYIRELTTAGFLTRTAGKYSLGPRIIELDFFIRQNDPRLQVVQPLMRAVSDRLECDTLWTNFFGDHVVVAHHEKGAAPLTVSYGRGRRMPLFRGAGSKVILAALPAGQLKRLFVDNSNEIAAAGLGNSWKEFRSGMAAIRRSRFFVSKAELEPGNVGVAAPIASDAPNPPGSLVLVFSEKRHATADEAKIVQITMEVADQISGLIANSTSPQIVTDLLKKKPA